MKVKKTTEGGEPLLYWELNHADEDKNRMVSIGKLFFLAALLLIILGGGRHLLMGQPVTGMNAVSEVGVGNGLAPASNVDGDVAKTEAGGRETSVGSLYYSLWSPIPYWAEIQNIDIDSILLGDKDWCDCGKRGKLYVRPKNAPHQVRSFFASSDKVFYAVWCNDVKEVEWRCDGSNWERAYFSGGQRVWPLKFTHENKNTCHRCWWQGLSLKCSDTERSGRIEWLTPTAKLDRDALKNIVWFFEAYYGYGSTCAALQTAEASLGMSQANIANMKNAGDFHVESLMSNIVSDELEVAAHVGGEIGSSLREKAFDALDTNGDEILDTEELKQINHRIAEAYRKLTDAQIDQLRDNLSFPKFDGLFDTLAEEKLETACATLEHLKGIDLKQVFDEIVGTGPYKHLNLAGHMQDYLDDFLGATAIKKNEFDDYMEFRRYDANNYQKTMKMPQICDGVDTSSAINKRRKLFVLAPFVTGAIGVGFLTTWAGIIGASIGAGIGDTIQECIEDTSRCSIDNAIDVGGDVYLTGKEYNPFGRRNMIKIIQNEFVAKEG